VSRTSFGVLGVVLDPLPPAVLWGPAMMQDEDTTSNISAIRGDGVVYWSQSHDYRAIMGHDTGNIDRLARES
jgi:hypothetical protein